MMRPVCFVILAACALLGREAAAAGSGVDVPLFTIAKSENRNLVQYAIHVDPECVPAASEPVFAYWRMAELGPSRTAPLLSREVRAYGLRSQHAVPPATQGAAGAVRIVLAAVPDRPVLVETWKSGNGTCRATSTVRITAEPAHLYDVFVRLKPPFGVDYLLLQGWAMDGSRRVEEKLAR